MQRIELIFPFLLVCCTLTVLMSGCAKENLRHQDISGTVTNLTTDQAMIGAKVQLIEEHMPSEPFSAITRTVVQTVLTDESGAFTFDPLEKVKRNRTYLVELEKNWYYSDQGWQDGSYEQVHSSVELIPGKSTELELQTVPLGNLDLVFDNTSEDSVFVHGICDNGVISFNVVKRWFERRQYYRISNLVVPSGVYDVTWYMVVEGDTNSISETLNVPFAEKDIVEVTIDG